MEIKEQLQEIEDKLSKGLKEAYKKMITFKQQKKTSIIVSKNGKIIEIKPK